MSASCTIICAPHHTPAGHIPYIHYQVDFWGPELKLSLPCRQGGQGDDQKERTIEKMDVEEAGDEGNCLDGLTQTHLVCKDYRVIPMGKRMEQFTVFFSVLLSS